MQPLFIIGAPRSGTTFLAELVSDMEYGCPIETHFITKYSEKLHLYGDLDNIENCTRLIKHILSERPIQQWNIPMDPGKIYANLCNNRSINYASIVDEIMMNRARIHGHSCWGDKTPHYIEKLPVLAGLFPNAKYIYIIRDGRDVALSLVEKPWGPNNILVAAEYWAMLNKPSKTISSLQESGQLIKIRYEDLILNPKKTIKSIYSHLDKHIESNKLEWLSNKINISSHYRWKLKMSTRQVRVFEGAAADTLHQLGYELNNTTKQKPSALRSIYLIHDLFFRWKHLFKQNTIDAFLIRFFNKDPFAE